MNLQEKSKAIDRIREKAVKRLNKEHHRIVDKAIIKALLAVAKD